MTEYYLLAILLRLELSRMADENAALRRRVATLGTLVAVEFLEDGRSERILGPRHFDATAGYVVDIGMNFTNGRPSGVSYKLTKPEKQS